MNELNECVFSKKKFHDIQGPVVEQVDHPAPSTVRQEQESVVSVSHKFCNFLEPCHYSKNSVRLS